MDNQQFAAVLQGAVAGRHEDLEQILELYEPLIRKHSLHSGTFNEDLHQYLLYILHSTLTNSPYKSRPRRITLRGSPISARNSLRISGSL